MDISKPDSIYVDNDGNYCTCDKEFVVMRRRVGYKLWGLYRGLNKPNSEYGNYRHWGINNRREYRQWI